MRHALMLSIGLMASAGVAFADGGTIKGKVVLTGKAPAMEPLKRQTDPVCAKTPMKEETVVQNANGTLRNVLVYVKGAPAAAPPAKAARIDQSACMYRPRVQGIVAGQTLEIRNGDATLHNVHTYRGSATLFNQAQVQNAPGIEKKFTFDGVLIKFKCDVHQWMTGYVWVQNNPYFAVTDGEGGFEIGGVPPGTYTIVAWHERFGEKPIADVTVTAGKVSEIEIKYAGTETAK
jgi:plastocyanin